MRRPLRAILLVPVLALLAACEPIRDALRADDRCGPELRTTVGRDGVGPETVPFAIAQVQLVELRDDSLPPRVSLSLSAWNAARSPLEGHVLRATLLDPAGMPLARFPVGAGPGSLAISQRPVVVERPDDRAAIRSHLIARDAVLEIRTDLPGQAVLRTPLRYGEHSEYAREICPKNRDA